MEDELLKRLNEAQQNADKWFSKYEGQRRLTRKLLVEKGQTQSYIDEILFKNKELTAQVINLKHNTVSIKAEKREDRLKIHQEEIYTNMSNEIRNLKKRIQSMFEARDKLIAENSRLTAALTAAGQLREQQLHDSATKLP